MPDPVQKFLVHNPEKSMKCGNLFAFGAHKSDIRCCSCGCIFFSIIFSFFFRLRKENYGLGRPNTENSDLKNADWAVILCVPQPKVTTRGSEDAGWRQLAGQSRFSAFVAIVNPVRLAHVPHVRVEGSILYHVICDCPPERSGEADTPLIGPMLCSRKKQKTKGMDKGIEKEISSWVYHRYL